MKKNTDSFRGHFNKMHERQAFWEELAILGFTSTIAERMEAEGITNTQFAQKMGVSPAFVTKLINGTNNFTIKTMVKVARALGTELSLNFRERQSDAQ
jgi:transcriptional regulator with XRE-family HTH domain